MSDEIDDESKESSSMKGVLKVVNNQYDVLKWMEETVDNLWAEFEVIDYELKRKLLSKY